MTLITPQGREAFRLIETRVVFEFANFFDDSF